MLVPLLQLLVICSFLLLAASPVALVVFLANYFYKGTNGRRAILTGAFLLGALASGFLVWRLVPPEWTLSFWATLEASVDAQKYGHPVEHYAEGLVIGLLFVAATGGAVAAGMAALGARLGRKIPHA